MAHILAARTGETTTTTGTGAYTVAGAIDAYHKAFSDVTDTNDYFYGFVEAVDAGGVPTGEWEEGRYTVTAANTIARTEIHASSNSDLAVSWAAGTKHIRIAMTARLARTLIAGSVGSNAPGAVEVPVPSSVRPAGVPDIYGALLFQDEFDGTSLDTTKWNTKIWYETEPDTVNYSVANGVLNIYPMLNTSGQYFNRTIDTDGKYYQLYGYFEIEAKLPIGYGAWPAIWLFNHIGADRPEMDIMEAYCGGENAGNGGWSTVADHPTSYTATLHRTLGDVLFAYNNVGNAGFAAVDLSAAMHKYGMHWDATGARFTFDGQWMGERFESNAFTRDMYLMLDLWFGSASGDPNNPGVNTPAPTGIGNAYQVNYFRAWSIDGTTGGTVQPGTSTTATNVEFWGASTIYGYKSGVGGQVAATIPQQFASAYPGVVVTNQGHNSVSSKEMLEGSGDMAPFGGWLDNMAASNASHIILNVGINDAADGRPKADYKYYIQNLIQQAMDRQKRVIIMTVQPTSTMDTNSYATWSKEVANAMNAGVIDVNAYVQSYMTANGLSILDVCPDGIHFSDAMYILVGDYVAAQFPNVQ